MAGKMESRVENGNTLVLERTFNASQERLFSMFKEAEHLKKFWGPRGWEVIHCTVDFRPEGVWHYCMKCMDKKQGDFFGMEAWGKGVYKKINEPKSFDYVDFFSDKDGNANPSMPSTDIKMEFIAQGDTTKLVSRGTYVSAEALKTVMDMGMLQGITETWDRLEEALAKK